MRAFYHLCSVLSNACMLTVPTSQEEFVLQTYASVLGVGADLTVIRDGEKLPVSFYAKLTRGAGKSYSATELEALGIVCAVEHFSHYARCFKMFTDHKALCSALSFKGLNRRLQRMALMLQPWACEICYLEILIPMDFQDKSGASKREFLPLIQTMKRKPEVSALTGGM